MLVGVVLPFRTSEFCWPLTFLMVCLPFTVHYHRCLLCFQDFIQDPILMYVYNHHGETHISWIYHDIYIYAYIHVNITYHISSGWWFGTWILWLSRNSWEYHRATSQAAARHAWACPKALPSLHMNIDIGSSHMIHGAGIFTYMPGWFMLGKCWQIYHRWSIWGISIHIIYIYIVICNVEP